MSNFTPTPQPTNPYLTTQGNNTTPAGSKKKPTAVNTPQTGMVVSDISPFQVTGVVPAIDAQASMRADVRAPGKVYDVAFNAADPQQFAAASSSFFDGLRKTNVYGAQAGFANDLEYLQAAVRSGGLSKGTSQVGDISLEDYSAIQKVFQTSYLRGYDWATTLQRDLTSPYFNGAGSGFTKNMTTAMHLLDATDAENRLSDAYFKAFGVYPTQKKIEAFRTKYNAEAKKQAAVTTTVSGKTSTKTTVANEGFTAEEQQQFLANYLKTNYKITGKEDSGYVAGVIQQLKNAYAENMIPADNDNNLIAFAADLIGTSDTAVQSQKIQAKMQSIRDIAAKQYTGVADLLAAGNNVAAVLDPIVKSVNSALGTSLDRNDARFKAVLNYNDGKTTRVMNAAEIDNFIEKQPEFQTSAAGYAKYANWGQALKGALS